MNLLQSIDLLEKYGLLAKVVWIYWKYGLLAKYGFISKYGFICMDIETLETLYKQPYPRVKKDKKKNWVRVAYYNLFDNIIRTII